jgi:hypothetical protein
MASLAPLVLVATAVLDLDLSHGVSDEDQFAQIVEPVLFAQGVINVFPRTQIVVLQG